MKPLILIVTFVALAGAQKASFEVAAIKPNRSAGGMSSIRPSPGRVTMENVALRKIILNAYGIPDDRTYALVGPDWLASDAFDVQATFPPETPLPVVREMLQSLLAERFQLTLHKETRQLPMYALVVAKGGPKIHPVDDGQSRTSGHPGRLEAAKISMQKLADLLGRMAGQQVTDATHLSGVFDFKLEWSPDETARMSPDEAVAAAATGPSLYSALQEQLGLKLEGRKGPVEVLVVDQIEKMPTGN